MRADAVIGRKGAWWGGEDGWGREPCLIDRVLPQGQNGPSMEEMILEGQGEGLCHQWPGWREDWASAESRPALGVPARPPRRPRLPPAPLCGLYTHTHTHTHVCTCTHIHFTTAWASRVFHLPLAAMWGNSFPKMPQPRRAGRLGNSQESWPPGSGGCVSTNQRCQRLVLGAPGVGQFAHRGVSKQKEISFPRPPRTLSPKLHQQEELCFHLRFPAQQTSLSQPR